ncbi:hypothetical protein ACTCUF_07995 [Lactococcus lactis]|uniref:hypothetical protein n=1 Tax=Lactococcus lactis TaxID=1358 RepID=UPI003F82799F
MNINIDLGNIWEALSAVGTIGAVIVSLWLARKDGKKKFQVVLKTSFGIRYDNSIDERPYLSIDAINKSNIPLTIEEVGFINKKDGKKVTVTDQRFLIEGSNQLPTKTEPYSLAMFVFNQEQLFKELHKKWSQGEKVRAYVRDSSGKHHFSKHYKV